MAMLYPLQFEPIDRKVSLGGRILKISDRSDAESYVRNGRLMGKSLHELVRRERAKAIRSKCRKKRFPLLIKIIDAEER